MTIYNINLGIGWASSGVEYAQAYRASIFRELGVPAKFIFTDMFQFENLQHFTQNIGFKDEEIIWLYSAFTDVKVAPTSYRRHQLEKSFVHPIDRIEENDQMIRYYFKDQDFYVNATVYGDKKQYIQRVEYVSKGQLIRKDYFSYTKIFSEYYQVENDHLHLYQRTFFNEDGSQAYQEILQGNDSIFQFSHHICYSKEELVGLLLDSLSLTEDDLLILDRATGLGQAVFQHHGAAKLAVVIHAEHFNEKASDGEHILWNNYYEYQFCNADKVDAFITATQKQKLILEQQFKQYTSFSPTIVAIPVGSLAALRYPDQARKPFSLLTSSRLAGEKHIDWLIKAVVLAHESLPEVTFDIYGEGGQREKLAQLIRDAGAEDYICLKGHQNLTEIYKNYTLYLAASTSEGFGLTLMEAVGSGLPLIGLDVPYGNQTFIDHGKNGYLLPREEPDDSKTMAQAFASKIVQYYTELDQERTQQHSYKKAQSFLHHEVAELWQHFVKEIRHDSII